MKVVGDEAPQSVRRKRDPALREKAFKLRVEQSLSYRAIGDQLGIDLQTVRNWIHQELEKLPTENVDEIRRHELDRLDRAMNKVQDAIDNMAYNVDDLVKLVNALLRIQERRSKFLGLDAPTRADITMTEVTQEDIKLYELANEMRAKVAAEEAMLRA